MEQYLIEILDLISKTLELFQEKEKYQSQDSIELQEQAERLKQSLLGNNNVVKPKN